MQRKTRSKTVAASTPPALVVRSGGALLMDEAVDCVHTTRGLTWGVKVTHAGADLSFVMIFVKNGAGQWASDGTPESIIDDNFAANMEKTYRNDVPAWIEKVAIPAINSWLAVKFLPGAPVQSSVADQADLAIRALRVMTRPDGTVYVQAP